LPIRLWKRLKRDGHRLLGHDLVLRNWELQFLGQQNEQSLEQWLFKNQKFKELVPVAIVKDTYEKFKTENNQKHSHPLSMLLTLSLFSQREKSFYD